MRSNRIQRLPGTFQHNNGHCTHLGETARAIHHLGFEKKMQITNREHFFGKTKMDINRIKLWETGVRTTHGTSNTYM